MQVRPGGAVVLPRQLVVGQRGRGGAAQEQLVDGESNQLVLGDVLDPDGSVVDDVGGLSE